MYIASMIYKGSHTALERFLRYVQVDTESDPNGTETPTTQKQFDLANILADELKEMGASDVIVGKHCYVMASAHTWTHRPMSLVKT